MRKYKWVSYVITSSSTVRSIMNRDPNPKRNNGLFAAAAVVAGLSLAYTCIPTKPPQKTDLASLVETGKVVVCKTPRNFFRFTSLLSNDSSFDIPSKEVPTDSSIRAAARDCPRPVAKDNQSR